MAGRVDLFRSDIYMYTIGECLQGTEDLLMEALNLEKFPKGPLGMKYRELPRESIGHSHDLTVRIIKSYLPYWSKNTLRIKGFGGISNVYGNILKSIPMLDVRSEGAYYLKEGSDRAFCFALDTQGPGRLREAPTQGRGLGGPKSLPTPRAL